MPPRSATAISGLYAITRETADSAALLAAAEAALRGGARVLQYRDKSGDRHRREAQAAALVALCRRFGATMIVNDDVELAACVDADGVHLGVHDGAIAVARRRIGSGRLIGRSCYDRFDNAERAVADGADYVAFGAFFASTTKPLARRAALELLPRARALGVPVVAIGGIDAENGAVLVRAGADALAVVGAIWDAADPERAARSLSSLFDSEAIA
jgi:thiamine-phosphate pyrophosphorylase